MSGNSNALRAKQVFAMNYEEKFNVKKDAKTWLKISHSEMDTYCVSFA